MELQNFETLAQLVKAQSGLVLTIDKTYLLESRLAPVARKWMLPTVEALAEQIKKKPDQRQIHDVVEAMTTNESSFFRDNTPFDLFITAMLPYFKKAHATSRTLRIWSAACSSGQEAYSLAMILKERETEFAGWHIEIVGTDISDDMIHHAKEGVFTHFEVQRGLPIKMLLKHFHAEGDKWRINDNLRQMVQFRHLNLLHGFSGLGVFDIVFCRNVLIYFDKPTKAGVLEGISRQMSSDGFLVLGGAETVLGIAEQFEPIPNQRGLYALMHKAEAKAKA